MPRMTWCVGDGIRKKVTMAGRFKAVTGSVVLAEQEMRLPVTVENGMVHGTVGNP